MTTVLIVRVGNAVAGACAKPCYDAEHKPCHCVCCGMNHAAGLDRAVANTRLHYVEWVAGARAAGWPAATYELGLPVVQHALF